MLGLVKLGERLNPPRAGGNGLVVSLIIEFTLIDRAVIFVFQQGVRFNPIEFVVLLGFFCACTIGVTYDGLGFVVAGNYAVG